jgi:dihydrofolate reductase
VTIEDGSDQNDMSKLRLSISMSLDGFVAGPHQSVENPLGIGGMSLHEWVFPLRAFREMHGEQGGEVNESSAVIEEMFANVGATIMGRNMFGGYPGPWSLAKPWNGWWGKNPPFHHPVFVVTHHTREPLRLEGGTTFYFITDGVESALEKARQVASGKDVHLGGGANVARQYFIASLIDEIDLNLAPMLLGNGERLFENTGDNLHGLRLVRTIATPKVTHLKFQRD